MSDGEKWKLGDGVYVEDLIYKHGLRGAPPMNSMYKSIV